MPEDPALQVVVGDQVIQCQNVDDKMRLEPVGGILADGSTEGYGLDELDKMVEIFGRYSQAASLTKFKQLVQKRRQGEQEGKSRQ
jgi:hypothetical protein